jgi:flagellar assembly protein FliH
LSKPVVKREAGVEPFVNVLGPAEELVRMLRTPAGRAKLGRSASALQRIRELAKKDGHIEGYDEGYQKGRAEGRDRAYGEQKAHIAQFAKDLDAAAARVVAAVEQWYRVGEENLAKLSTAVAARVIGRELRVGPDVIVGIVRDAMKEVMHADSVRIRLHPFDLATIREHLPEIQAVAPSVRRVEIVEDQTIESGCRIESDAGVIDATIRAQLELALEAIGGEE